ncbi:Unknown protein [Striga hermonthica]|uniref:CCHC-type domain-containing protein n=1 Tax=Striga hermonthica TaxID=68872 RepID=A0A9N7R7Q1_STRHE|nr:Unknown protein [Striga hermonthica]
MSFATAASRQSSSRPPRPSSSARHCHLCGRSGHDAQNCFRVKPCPHCHRPGHDPRRCFEVVGYPANWSGKSSSTGAPPAGQGRSISASSSSSAGSDRGLISSHSAKAHANNSMGANSVGPGLIGPGTVGPSLQFGTYGTNPVPAATGLSPDQWQALVNITMTTKVSVGGPMDLWHQRLGYPPPQADLPIDFWGHCVLTAGYLINRTPTPLLHGNSPYEVLFGQAPPIKNLRVFGCLCYVHNLDRSGDIFASRSRKCIFVGYPFGKKGWSVFDLDTREFLVSRDVKFFEGQFPFSTCPTSGSDSVPLVSSSPWPAIDDESSSILDSVPAISPSGATEVDDENWVRPGMRHAHEKVREVS